MIKNNCQKQAIRDRMARTGEDFATAREAHLAEMQREREASAKELPPLETLQTKRGPKSIVEKVDVGTPKCRLIRKTPRPKVSFDPTEVSA